MDWIAANWFWLLILVGWVVFLARIGEEADRRSRNRECPSDIGHLPDHGKRRSARYLEPVRRHAIAARARLSSLSRRRAIISKNLRIKPRLKIPDR